MSERKREVVDLGWCMARYVEGSSDMNGLTIMSPELYDSETNQPAASINIYGRDNVVKLRDFLNKVMDGE